MYPTSSIRLDQKSGLDVIGQLAQGSNDLACSITRVEGIAQAGGGELKDQFSAEVLPIQVQVLNRLVVHYCHGVPFLFLDRRKYSMTPQKVADGITAAAVPANAAIWVWLDKIDLILRVGIGIGSFILVWWAVRVKVKQWLGEK